jgi:hypothetical protein
MDEQIKQIDSWNNDGKFADITPVLDKLLSEDPDNPELLYRKVRLLYRLYVSHRLWLDKSSDIKYTVMSIDCVNRRSC